MIAPMEYGRTVVEGHAVTAYFNYEHCSEEMDFDVTGSHTNDEIIAAAEEWGAENLDATYTSITLGQPSCGTVTIH